MTVELRPLNEINERAVELLTRELGISETLRFMMQFSIGEGDYTKERQAMLGDRTVDEIVEQMRQRRQGDT